jgi:hypothetical protein
MKGFTVTKKLTIEIGRRRMASPSAQYAKNVEKLRYNNAEKLQVSRASLPGILVVTSRKSDATKNVMRLKHFVLTCSPVTF